MLTAPAYLFHKFRNLPIELQAHIWDLASRAEEPRTYTFKSLARETSGTGYYHENIRRRANCKVSSQLFFDDFDDRISKRKVPSALHVCSHSREVARKLFTLLPSCASDIRRGRTSRKCWFNTLYDRFYISGPRGWQGCKLLVDFLVQACSSRPLYPTLQEHLARISNIQLLLVDINVFGSMTPQVWTNFRSLRVLTIVFYPYKIISDNDCKDDDYPLWPEFVKAQKGTTYGRRASRILEYAGQVMKDAKEHAPQWNVPNLEALVRVTGNDNFDMRVQREVDPEYDFGSSDDSDEEPFYESLAQRMKHEIPVEIIKQFKTRFHLPIRKRVKLSDGEGPPAISSAYAYRRLAEKRPIVEKGYKMVYVTDSEGEEGRKDAPDPNDASDAEEDSWSWRPKRGCRTRYS